MHHSAPPGDLLARLAELVPARRRLQVHQCVDMRVPASWGWTTPLVVDGYHLLYVRGGTGGYGLPNRELRFEPGSVVVLGSGVAYTAWQDQRDPPDIVSIHCGLYDLPLRADARRRILAHSAQAYAIDAPGSDEGVTMRAGWFARIAQAHAAGRDGEASSLLHALLCDLGRGSVALAQEDTGLDPRIERVRAQLDLHPIVRLTVDDMAERAGLSRNYFVRLFTQQVGATPKAYQITARMRFAKYLLEHTDASIQKVASDCQFPDPYAFSKQFRKFHGYPPSAIKGRR